MLKAVGALLVWGLMQPGGVPPLDPGQDALLRTGGGRMPLPSELLIETYRMDQARRMQEEQTRKFEGELKCRRYPEKCLPLIDVKPRPRLDLDEGRVTIEGVPEGPATEPAK